MIELVFRENLTRFENTATKHYGIRQGWQSTG